MVLELVNPRKLYRHAMPVRLRVLLLVLALAPGGVQAQAAASFDEVGRFYMRSFAPEDYGGHNQNWAVVQDERGFVYVGNSTGVLEYDGVSWRKIDISNRSVVRSLVIDSDSRIFIGATAEIGYLAPGPRGELRYVSLVEHIPEEDRGFTDVWQTHALSDGVYFQSRERLFRWRDGEIEVWRSETGFRVGLAVHDTFYVTDDRTGELFYINGDTLRPAPGGALFAGQRIYALVPHGADFFLAITRRHGMMRCRRSTPEKEPCAAYAPDLTEMLARLEPYCAALLPGDLLAIGTRRGGLVLIDRDARLLRVLTNPPVCAAK